MLEPNTEPTHQAPFGQPRAGEARGDHAPDKPVPITSLVEYFEAPTLRSAALLKHFRDHPDPLPSADDRRAGLALLAERDPELRRTRSLYDEALRSAEHKLRPAIGLFVLDVISLRLGEDAAERIRGRSPVEAALDAILETRPLAHSDSEMERAWIAAAMLAIQWLADNRNLSVDAALAGLRALLGRPAEYDAPSRNPRRIKIMNMTDHRQRANSARGWLDVVAHYADVVAAAGTRAEAAERRRQHTQEDLAESEADLAAAKTRIASLEGELAEARLEGDRLAEQVRGAEVVGTHGLRESRARSADFLTGRLGRLLEAARDALRLEPPRAHIAAEKLDAALDTIGEEARWLRSSD